MKKSVLFLACILSAFVLQAQIPANQLRDTITNRIATQLDAWPQEKIHLHTDRDYYTPGEKIWFKAYVADAATNQPMTDSRYVYVELINDAGLVMHHTTLRCTDGMYHGNIFLSDIIPAGYYTIRAYTHYMENPEEDYFFRKQIRIGSIERDNKVINPGAPQKKTDTKRDDYAVSFFPEGGNLPMGDLVRIAYKAVNINGNSEHVSGKIIDEKGETITETTTGYAGMGSFAFIPEEGKQYIFHSTNSKGTTKLFELPAARKEAFSLSVYLRNQQLSVARTGQAGKNPVPQHYLLIHCRGQVLHFAAWNNQEPYYTFPANQLPTGVLQCLLFDEELNPLSERLVFNRGTDQATLSFNTNKESYKTREKIAATMQVTDENGIPLKGSYSVAITDDMDIQPDNTNTILSSLLLASELKGHIESPGYYFEGNDPARETALDNLLMTQGWRRYNIPDVINGQITTPIRPFETDMAISGMVKSGLFGRPVADGDVTLLSASEGTVMLTKTDANGRFAFTDFDFPDTLNFTLQARNKKSGENVWLEADTKTPQPAKALRRNESLFPSALSTVKTTDVPVDPFMEKAQERYKYDKDMRVIYLKEVEVIGRRPQQTRIYSQYTNFARTIIGEDWIERAKPSSTEQLFRSIPGLMITPNRQLRITRYLIGASNFETGGSPLILLDGYEAAFAMDIFDLIPIDYIKAVEVISGPETAIFGRSAPFGAINIVTIDPGKRPVKIATPNIIALTRYGYQEPVEFYNPVYETEEQRFNILPDLRTTIWWKPDVVTTEEGKAGFEFYASDYATTYSVVIEGLSEDGVVVRKTEKITVK